MLLLAQSSLTLGDRSRLLLRLGTFNRDFLLGLFDFCTLGSDEAFCLGHLETFTRHFLTNLTYQSEAAPAVLLHFSQHPEALTALETVPAALAQQYPVRMGPHPRDPQQQVDLNAPARAQAHMLFMKDAFHRLEGRLLADTASAEARPAGSSSTVTTAPKPATTLRRAGNTLDPKAAALKNRDFASYSKTRSAERLASRQMRSGAKA